MGTHDNVLTYRLGTGVLDLAVDVERFGPDLFRVAERINPKRSFLFVSTMLGRHIPVRPSDHFAAVNGIVDQIPDPLLSDPVLVLGYAETAVGIGAAVARRISRQRPDVSVLYLSTTRHPVEGLGWVGFSEGHSHATAHHVMDPPDLKLRSAGPVTLVLVDDETTTGSTFAALFGALRDGGLPIGRVLLLTFTDWSAGAAMHAISDLAPDLPVGTFSLMQGRWNWKRDPAAALPVVPSWSGSPVLAAWEPDLIDDPLRRAPRLGLRLNENVGVSQLIERLGAPEPGAPVLVIGTGEHVWGPMLLAEGLEQAGADVRLVATTRSPILKGDVVRHKVTFPDHFGAGVPMYLHNVPAQPDARVILMTETGADGVCPQLRSHLGRGQIVDGHGLVTGFGTA